MTHHTTQRLLLLASLLLSACEAPDVGGLSFDHERSEADATEAPSSNRGAPSGNVSAPTPSAPAGLPYRTPTEHLVISDASEVWSTAPAYKGESPGARAKDKHPVDVTGKDCLTCHDGAAAPQFAFGGTIADGKAWEWEAWDWSWGPAISVYGRYGGYDDGAASGGSGYGGGWQNGRKGWPRERTAPSPRTEVRIIGADGLVFETTTDEDGNYWYKTKSALKQPAHTGIRRGSFLKALRSNGSACASCHESGEASSPGRIWTWNGEAPVWPWTH